MSTVIAYDQLAEVLARIGYAEAAAEFHGSLCGALCLQPPENIDLLRLLEPGDAPPPADGETRAALETLRSEAVGALQDSEMVFSPLLPDDEVALVPRVRALVSWCEGFLYGLASQQALAYDKLSEEAREILRDFTEFTQAAVGDEDPDIEESAYAELVEYVRVGAQLVYMELHPRPTLDPAESRHLH
ncbi:hypothetical protein SAMN04488038_10310 [Solimonas aquatica]|uniref:YecA family protein n=1 Tax=Solimonas aquatica TaxID=489703 RepID=A0A1H9CDC2_9GAMM|nr:UPF0149 family protein [Solimonas aquatica]SEP99144.1 hypothetical protein SAMN04488038_10310 [Solimonas aquatica]